MLRQPASLNPYAYVLNNPVLYTDPSGENPFIIAALIGGFIGAGINLGAQLYNIQPQNSSQFLHCVNWSSVAVAFGAGAVAGLVGFGIGGLVAGLPGLGGAIFGGIATGAAASAAGQVAVNVLTNTLWYHDVGWAAITGSVSGGIAGGLGYGIRGLTSPFRNIDWSSYPDNPKVPKPSGAFRILEGAEYETARAQANAANRALHRANPALNGLTIHEIKPVKFSGSPTVISNKVPLTTPEHAQFTNWWSEVLRKLNSK